MSIILPKSKLGIPGREFSIAYTISRKVSHGKALVDEIAKWKRVP